MPLLQVEEEILAFYMPLLCFGYKDNKKQAEKQIITMDRV